MNMFATTGGVVELWVIQTDTFTSKTSGEVFASVQAISPIPEGARGNAKGFEITQYDIEPTLLDAIVFEGSPVLCKFATVVRPTKDRFGNTKNTQVLTELLATGKDVHTPAPSRQPQPQAQAQRPTQPAAEKPSDSSKS
ncbi:MULTISPECIES: DNA-binding protein [Pseudomonas]|uniref:DNA-binding protein n=1 Tax=Pseudomonas nitroreducens TaxID=46680 RepID=UPI001E449AD1|nr:MULTISPECIES: DNA-binding protein [Pseudomonas]MCE4073606.1 DNA-binding protein [Pseudomonas nitritireducens]MCE4082799.1 DNA-binding protein [Pseudomonas nitroreducens]